MTDILPTIQWRIMGKISKKEPSDYNEDRSEPLQGRNSDERCPSESSENYNGFGSVDVNVYS